VFRTAADGTRTPARDHPLYGAAARQPECRPDRVRLLGFRQFVDRARRQRLRGQGIGTLGRIRALTLLRPTAVTVRRDSSGALRYTWSEGSRRARSRRRMCCTSAGLAATPLGGVSTLSMCRGPFGAALSAERASAAILRNGVRPSGTLSTDVKFQTPEQRAEMESLLARSSSAR
jgi:hypothetical protein